MPSAAAFWIAFVVAMVICFRVPILSGLDLGFGDRGDSIIEIALLEHWRNVFVHGATWNLPGYFYPYADTLGYNDGYFLYGLVYSGWRLVADPFLADTLNIATFKAIGFVSAYWLVAKSLAWGKPVALLIAILFTIANGMAVQAGHAQLHSIGLLPIVAMLVIGAVRAARARQLGRGAAFGMMFAALMAAWLLTSYYPAWFTLFFLSIMAACWLWKTRQIAPRAIIALVRRYLVLLGATGLTFAVCIVPFLVVYMAKLRETGGHGYMISPLVTPVDLVNVGPGNYVWGWIFRVAKLLFDAIAPGSDLYDRSMRGEHETGFPLILFALTTVAVLRVLRRGRAERPMPRELVILTLAVVIGWALTLHVWFVSLWGLAHFLVPGARGIRIVLRYQLFLVLPVLVLVFAVHRERFMGLVRGKPWVAAGLAAILIAEQLNGEPAAELSRSTQLSDLWSIPAPPADCQSFYVVAARHSEVHSDKPGSALLGTGLNGVYPHNVDAMLLAQLWRVPTINGFSTFNPPDWNFARPLDADYDVRVASYVRRHALRNVCRLDVRQAAPWTRID